MSVLQTNIPPSLSGVTSLIYLDISIDVSISRFISCVITMRPKPVDLETSQEYAERLASLIIAQISSLRYISLGFSSPGPRSSWMWKVEDDEGERTLRAVPPNIAQRLKVVLKSPNYDLQRESEGEPSIPLRVHRPVDINDVPYSHGMRLVPFTASIAKGSSVGIDTPP